MAKVRTHMKMMLRLNTMDRSEDQAQFNYERAGKLIPEQKQPINIDDYKDHLLPGVVVWWRSLIDW